MFMELISCITPTFNRKDLLERSVNSTLNQTWPNWELVVVDDGSEDGTAEMMASYCSRDKRIKFYRNPGKGASSARNFGIRKSNGDYIVFLDDDDEHLPHRFESQINAVKISGEDFILSGFQVKDLKTGRIILTDMGRSKGRGAGHGVRWMISREILNRAGLFDEEMPAMQEVELSYRIARYYNYAFHNDIVVVGGVNHNSITKSKDKMITGRKMLIEKHASEMDPVEAAWWEYIVAMDYYSTGDNINSEIYFKKAAEGDPRGIFRFAHRVFRVTNNFKGPLRSLSGKILSFLSDFRFPEVVKHKIVKQKLYK